MSQDIFPFGGPKNGPVLEEFPVDIKFGQLGAAIPCAVCQRLNNTGFFVIYKTKMRMCCIKCIVMAVKKHQEMHPTETFLEFDIDASDNDYKYAVKALRDKYPEMDDEKAMEVAQTVVRAIG